MSSSFITALDIGSDTLKLGVMGVRNGKEPEILFLDTEPSWGLRRGVVIDPPKVAEKLRLLIERGESFLNRRIKEVICNVNGSHLFVTLSRGVVAVSRADQQISQEDIERVLAAAQAFSLSSNKEVLEVFPKEFIVDGEKGVKNPLGMKGVRLETEVLALCGFSPYLRNLEEALSLAELEPVEVLHSGLASARSILGTRQKELGVALLDIGAWTSNLVVFEEGDLLHLATFPVGSGHITNDIAIGLQTEIDKAEKIKREFGDCLYQKKGKGEKIYLYPQDFQKIGVNGKSSLSGKRVSKEKPLLVFSKKELVHIISARASEIFSLAREELKKIGKAKLLPAGIVLTGGGAKLPNIAELAKKELKLPSRIGFPKGIKGLGKDPSLAVLAGLLHEGIAGEGVQPKGPSFLGGLKRLFRIFLP